MFNIKGIINCLIDYSLRGTIMSVKTISLHEANLIAWFNGQVSMVESQSGKPVEKLSLQIDRTVSDDIQINLRLKPDQESPAQ